MEANNGVMEEVDVLKDVWCLLKHVSQIHVWELGSSSEFAKIGRERMNARRKKEIVRLGTNLKRAFVERVI